MHHFSRYLELSIRLGRNEKELTDLIEKVNSGKLDIRYARLLLQAHQQHQLETEAYKVENNS